VKGRVGARELALFTEAWLLLGWIDLVIRLLPYRRWRHWLDEGEPERRPPEAQPVPPLVTAVERAARRHWSPMNCLRRSLALRRLLRRRGIGSRLHLGVRRGDGGLEAHAWVSCGGQVLNDTPEVDRNYAELTGEAREALLTKRGGEAAVRS